MLPSLAMDLLPEFGVGAVTRYHSLVFAISGHIYVKVINSVTSDSFIFLKVYIENYPPS